MDGMTPITNPIPAMPTVQTRTDADVWKDILKLQLDGVMMHVALFEKFGELEVCGLMCLHKHHAEEEFNKYLHVTGDYIEEFKSVPIFSNINPQIVNISGKDKEKIMIEGMEAYETWEKQVCKHLKNYREELTENKEHVCYLIDDVKEELKCINLIMNDLIDGKYEELDAWLIKKWGD